MTAVQGAPPVTGPAPLATLVGLACQAPSVHNTQPWRWHIEGPVVELYADLSRQLTESDPTGRNLLLSCGAALHHLRVAAAAHGCSVTVERLPDARRPALLARVTLGPGERSATADDDLAAIAARVTDRRRFTSWPVPDSRLHDLAAVGSREGAVVVPLLHVAERHRTELLFARARDLQASHRAARAEQRAWVDRGAADGVPSEALPEGAAGRFRTGGGAGPTLEGSDRVLVVASETDAPLDHLRAGEALSAMWLRATTDHLSVVPLTQVVEPPETRNALRHEVLDAALHPHLVVRIGWQEIARSTLPRTPRRPLDEVLTT